MAEQSEFTKANARRNKLANAHVRKEAQVALDKAFSRQEAAQKEQARLSGQGYGFDQGSEQMVLAGKEADAALEGIRSAQQRSAAVGKPDGFFAKIGQRFRNLANGDGFHDDETLGQRAAKESESVSSLNPEQELSPTERYRQEQRLNKRVAEVERGQASVLSSAEKESFYNAQAQEVRLRNELGPEPAQEAPDFVRDESSGVPLDEQINAHFEQAEANQAILDERVAEHNAELGQGRDDIEGLNPFKYQDMVYQAPDMQDQFDMIVEGAQSPFPLEQGYVSEPKEEISPLAQDHTGATAFSDSDSFETQDMPWNGDLQTVMPTQDGSVSFDGESQDAPESEVNYY